MPNTTHHLAADSYRSGEIAHALALASEITDAPGAEGPGEVVAGSLAALAYLIRVGSATRSDAILGECEVIYRRTRCQLDAWRLDAGCEDWGNADWSRGEVCAVSECEETLARLRVALLAWARETAPATAERLAA